jgi:Ser/Thr protein kinase RdoA (MazF antagonist)
MRLIAAGRDCDILDVGNGTVIRRNRAGRSLEAEALVMTHARAHGYPVPAVHLVSGAELVMDLVQGPTMADDLLAKATAQRARTAGHLLADLHHRLHRIAPSTPGVGRCCTWICTPRTFSCRQTVPW